MKARIAPVLLAVAPVLSMSYFAPRVFSSLAALVPFIFVAAAALFAEQLVRHFGKAAEQRLIQSWDGLPTVRALRNINAPTGSLLKIRRREVERRAGVSLPSQRQERQNPRQADAQYDNAVRRCLAKMGKEAYPALFRENVAYGLSRNLYGLKTFALVVSTFSLTADIFLAIRSDTVWTLAFPVLTGSVALCGALWLVLVRRSWVHEQAQTFSDRFFLSLSV